jgi:hypothetical protein
MYEALFLQNSFLLLLIRCHQVVDRFSSFPIDPRSKEDLINLFVHMEKKEAGSRIPDPYTLTL